MKNLWSEIHPLGRAALFLGLIMCANVIYLFLLAGLEGTFELNMSSMPSFKLKVYTFLNQIIGFLLPALAMAYFIGNKVSSGIKLKTPPALTLILSAIGLLASLGFIGWIGEWNIEFFNQDGTFFEFCRNLEEQAAESIDGLLTMDNYGALAINILLIGLTPAVCEEFAFRGALQSQLQQAFKNHHIAIWLAAAIFSAIHFQFLGFLPRMLLGGLFGYLVVYTGSLWPAILAHFINNSIGVVTYYVAQNTDLITMEQAENAAVPWHLALTSVVLTLGIMRLIKQLKKGSMKQVNTGQN